MYQSGINPRRTPSFFFNVVDIDVRLQCTHFLSSQRQFIRIVPDHHLRASFWNFRLSYFKCSPVQVSNHKGALIVNLYEVSQPLRETFSAHLTEVCHDVLYETVSIFLLVRQQLQRIDQICAQALRYCMCSEDLGLIDIITCLHDQEPVRKLPIVPFSTDHAPPLRGFSPRDPQDAVFQGETVAMRAQERHRDSSLSSNWRDDSPQVVRASDHNFLHNNHLFCLLKCFFYSVKGTFPLPLLQPKMPLYSSPSPLFRAAKPFFIIFPCSKCRHGVLLAPSTLWLTIPAATDVVILPVFLLQPCSRNLFTLSLSRQKCSSHSSYILFFSHHFPKPSTMRFLPRELSPLPICQWFSSFGLQRIVVAFLACSGRVRFLTFPYHHRRQLPEAEGVFATLIVTTKQRLLPEH